MRAKPETRPLLLLFALAPLAGCAGDGPSLPSVGGAPDLAAIKPAVAPADGPRPVGAPTEIYTRVARGILSCWFGASGPLKPGYIYHADADPPSKGGGAVIGIHSRDKSVSDPRSIRAWKLAIVPAPEGTTVDIENLRLPAAYAEALERDARRWAAGGEGCSPIPVPVGEAAAGGPPVAAGSEAKIPPVAPPGKKAATAKPVR
jgi:hypothetical protein